MTIILPTIEHSWDLSPEDAICLQKKLAKNVVCKNDFESIKFIAGVDVAYHKNSDQLVAAIVILDAITLQIVETKTARSRSTFPYISGLFSFRELPPLLEAFATLETVPDLVICDGQGIAHPRRFGLASHLGVVLNIPSIGCAKTLMTGSVKSLKQTRGSIESLTQDGEIIGAALRTQDNIKPVYVSIGHRIDLPSACEWIVKLSPKYRLPETTRAADQVVRALIKADPIDSQ